MFHVLTMTKNNKVFQTISENSQNELKIETVVKTLCFIETLLNFDINLVILDVDLLKEKTIQMTRIIRKINRQTPIVVIASKESLSVCSAVFSMGISKYLVKPVTAQSIETLIKAIINKDVISKSNHTD